ncbi:MAG: hypothetical protein M3422_06100 [Actinomycetota bacterium]|nr:hypothetical protein [Actinomycetota bacterium]
MTTTETMLSIRPHPARWAARISSTRLPGLTPAGGLILSVPVIEHRRQFSLRR